MMNKENLQQWLFHFNPFTDKWCAAKRSDFTQFFNGDKGDLLHSSDIEVLKDLIIRTDGDKNEIEKLLNK